MSNIKFDDEKSICWLFPKIMVLLRKKIQKRLNSVDLLWDQWIVLSQIYRFEGTNQKSISKSSLKNEASLTRTINFLENNNLVRREVSKKDKRAFLIYTTDQGKKIFEESEKLMDEVNNEINEIFNQEDLKVMQSLLLDLFENLE
ncbi:MAG: MarR family winged helix-turn-helix transcriptional regulator [Methanobrevibacter sp.]|jgi:DNA-binding MarR family transcriptional regulator|nr:MarR family winged helix-turn-helix transcriptional regulator [Candidatus Methanoflexus mossambicus]